MNRYRAEDLLALSIEQIWAMPPERHIIEFSDGDLETHTRATQLSTYLWYPMRLVPGTPLVKAHHISSKKLGDSTMDDFSGKRMLEIINRCCWDIHAASNDQHDPEHLAKLAIEAVNHIFNDMTVKLSRHVTTLSMFDVVEVMDHPEIADANAKVQPNAHSIEQITYKRIIGALKDPHTLKGNPIALGIKAGTLKPDQVTQCFGPRGFPTDINSDIFAEPILTGFVQGIWDPYATMAESRAGSKALLYNKELLRSTEYFNRKTQLIAQYVTNLHRTDCGTPHYIDIPILEALLPQMKGKYYLDPDTNKLEWLRGNEKHLIGKRVMMRSVLGCVHPDPVGICSVCYGRLSYSIPYGTNIGHVSAVHIGDKITSKVLSTKHTDASSAVDRYQLHATEAKYLKYGAQDETLYLKQVIKNRKVTLVLERDEVHSLADVLMIRDLSAYPVGNASNLTKIGIRTETPDGMTNDVLNVSLYNRKSALSRDVLEHIQKVRWTHDERENVVIDLTGFDVNKPFLVLPFKHVNMFEVMKRIQSFLHSGAEGDKPKLGRGGYSGRTYLKNYRDPVEAAVVFASMLNEKLSANFVHCEVLIYAMMARNISQKDFRLPVPGIHGSFEKYSRLMHNRSLSGAMAYERQHVPLNSPASFIYKDRNDHPYDTVILGGDMG